jgi:hypothetical protein
MSTILFAWEMGTGLGHLTRIQPIASQLVALGHRVSLAARELGPAFRLFGGSTIPIFQAPIETAPRARTPTAETFAHILFNCGFAEPADVAGREFAWRNMFDAIQPDLVVADCSPTALLAAHCAGVKRVAIGTGFECPPDVVPLPSLRQLTGQAYADFEIEAAVLQNINLVCKRYGALSLERASKLYYGERSPILLTYEDLDCYAPRVDAKYWGAINFSNGVEPDWPEGVGPRVFAYMLEHEFTPAVVGWLSEKGWPTITVGGRECLAKSRHLLSSSVRLPDGPLDSKLLAEQCDITVCYSGHGTICQTLLAGKPLVILPTTVEQYVHAARVAKLGAGEMGQVGNLNQVSSIIQEVSANSAYTLAAKNFAAQNSHPSAQSVAQQVVAHLHALIAS